MTIATGDEALAADVAAVQANAASALTAAGTALTNVTETIQPDDPIKLATPIVAEEAVGGTVAVWGGFVWDDGDVWG